MNVNKRLTRQYIVRDEVFRYQAFDINQNNTIKVKIKIILTNFHEMNC